MEWRGLGCTAIDNRSLSLLPNFGILYNIGRLLHLSRFLLLYSYAFSLEVQSLTGFQRSFDAGRHSQIHQLFILSANISFLHMNKRFGCTHSSGATMTTAPYFSNNYPRLTTLPKKGYVWETFQGNTRKPHATTSSVRIVDGIAPTFRKEIIFSFLKLKLSCS